MKQQILFLLLVLSSISVCCFAEGKYHFRHYTVENGLSSNTVRSILQDHAGFMWFGTEDGLNRFDGYTFKVFKTKLSDTTTLGNNYVYALYEDKNNQIWVGTEEGIYIYNPQTNAFSAFKCKTKDGTSINQSIQTICADTADNLWIGTRGQMVFKYNTTTQKLEQFSATGGTPHRVDYFTTVHIDLNHKVWAATSEKKSEIGSFDTQKNDFVPFNQSKFPSALALFQMYEDSQHNFWLGTWESGLCKLDRITGKITTYLKPPTGIFHIHSIFEVSAGKLFVGSDDGLTDFNTETGDYEIMERNKTEDRKEDRGLSDQFVYPICKDREGGIWIGTYYGGINYLSPYKNLFESYTQSNSTNSVSGSIIGKFYEDDDQNLWITSDDGGLSFYNTKTHEFTQITNGHDKLSYHNIHAVCKEDHTLWVGTYSKGLNKLNLKNQEVVQYNNTSHNTSIDASSVYSIFKDKSKHLWIGTTAGINQYNYKEDNFTRMKSTNATVIDISEDQHDYIWFATWGKGVFRYSLTDSTWVNYTHQNKNAQSLPSNQINCICIDKKQQLWVGTSDGLCKFNYNSNQFESEAIDLKSNLICDIISNENFLWITTSKGLVRFDPDSKTQKVFTKSDGLQSDQFNIKSGIITKQGKIYVGTANGFNAFYPNQVLENKYVPPVAITGFQVFNKNIKYTNPITLNYKQNVFSIQYVSLSFCTAEKNHYVYKLEGFDKDWNLVGTQRKATYTNLPAGHYVFKVKASNNDGLWNTEGSTLDIIITPPIWATPIFRLLYILFFISIIIFIIWLINQNTKKKHKEQLKQLSIEKEKEVYNAKIEFFTLIAHEIRTPVSLIIAPLEKIQSEIDLNTRPLMNSNNNITYRMKEDINMIYRNSQRLLTLVNQLLDFRKAEQSKMNITLSEQNIYTLLQAIFDRFKPSIEQKNIYFTFTCNCTQLVAQVDPEALTKIISNLLSNAAKFTTNTIHLHLEVNDQDPKYMISVTDNGAGIPLEEQNKIFTPFYQSNINKALGTSIGTGIGLSLVRSLVDALNGVVAVNSIPYDKTTFTITLPQHTPTSQLTLTETITQENMLHVESTAPSPFFQEEKYTIHPTHLLIIEDDEDMRVFLHKTFAKDFTVYAASNGVQGLEILNKQEIHIIISDLMMPDMDGLQFCSELKKEIRWSQIPIILLTAKTDINTKIDALHAGIDDYIEKPFSTTYLFARVNNLLESRKALKIQFSEHPFVQLDSVASSQVDQKFLLKLNNIIDQNLSNSDFQIEHLADQLGVSRSALFTKIKVLTDCTPGELIQLIRLKKAAQLLAEKQYRINEICYLVGFNNPSYFSKCFHRQFGILPKDFVN